METASGRRRLLRFSLQRLLLIVVIVASAIGLVALALRNRELASANTSLAQENRRLRDLVGELTIDDPQKLHAIRVETHSDVKWMWLVWFPEGSRYRLRVEGGMGRIAESGWPEHGGTIWIRDPGEYRLEYVIQQSGTQGQWLGRLYVRYGPHNSHSAMVGADGHPWVEWPTKSSTTSGVGTSTESFPPGKRVELCRHIVSPGGSGGKAGTTGGFLIWLEPEP